MSDFFQWDESQYGLKIEQMDTEHKKLISIMNTLYDQYVKKDSYDAILTNLNTLGTFVVEHFKHEEDFFSKLSNYTKADTHIMIHKTLLNKFTEHVETFKKNKVFTEDFFQFLKTWLSAHIAGIDMQYSEAYRNPKAS